MKKLHARYILYILILPFLLFQFLKVEAQDEIQQNQMKFGRLLRLVQSYYVDTANISKLTEDAIVNLLSELDPHSAYISKEEVEKANEQLVGNFEGIGITFNILKDTLLVSTTIAGGPSEKVGLRAGDRIIQVDNKKITGIGLKNSDVFSMLRGNKGTEVNLKVLRRGIKEILDFTIIRDKIPIYSLDASYMINSNTGIIKLNKFAATTTGEFVTALKELKKQNLQNLILDLRGNGGGYLNTAVEISEQFLNNMSLVVYTSGLNEPRKDYIASQIGEFKTGNLVVLVDEMSASSSEIVSGAVQDWDRGVIIGRRSFGKGLVQKQMYLTDGSMVRLTTAHYYTPSGRCIQKPYAEGVAEYRNDVQKRFANGELFNADSIQFPDSLKFTTLKNKRTVYGGGGVMPDIFIPLDTSVHYQYINRLRRNNIIFNFSIDYLDKNRNELMKKYPDFKTFDSKFEVTDELIASMVENGVKDGIEKNESDIEFSKNDMKREIKAYLARDLFTRDDFYKVLFKDDKAIQESIRILNNQKEYNSKLVSNRSK